MTRVGTFEGASSKLSPIAKRGRWEKGEGRGTPDTTQSSRDVTDSDLRDTELVPCISRSNSIKDTIKQKQTPLGDLTKEHPDSR